MTLRGQLYFLALGAVFPIALLAAAAGVLLVQHEQKTMQQEAVGRARAALSTVDNELAGHISTIEALGASRNLEEGDLRAFHEEAVRVLRTQRDWLNIGLQSADGMRQLVDAVLPFGAPAPSTDEGSLKRAIETERPVIGDVAVGPAIRTAAVRLRVPVMVDGAVRYVISVPLRLERFQELLAAQRQPDDLVTVLVDRNKRFVARIPPQPPGNPISGSFRAALELSPEGFFRGETVEGFQTYTPYVTSAFSGWAFGIAIPQGAVEAGARRALAIIGLGSLAALAAAIWLAWLISRRIERPISALAQAASDLRQGRGVEIPKPAGLAPIGALADALHAAGVAMREREELLRREKAALEQADRAKDEFIAMLSHELRNPLAALTSAAEVLRIAPPQDEAAAKARGVVSRQTKHMARLVEDLLDVSRVAMGKAALEREPMNLADAARSALAAMRAAGRLAGHDVSLDLEPAWANADRARMEQIATNLLDNALKYTPRGKRIEVRVRRAGNEALLSVRDEGEGIRPEALEGIFELFVQGEHGLDRRKGGLGIGLTLVKRLAEQHGGSVSAESEGPGRGAIFTVRLPAVPPAAAYAPPSAKERHPWRSRRILVVEDNDDVRETLRAALALGGHEVLEARDGAQALGIADSARPEVIVVDIGLPGIDGFEVARRLRASPLNGRVALIALTGYGQPQDEQRTLAAGFDVHLVKPVTGERLADVIARIA